MRREKSSKPEHEGDCKVSEMEGDKERKAKGITTVCQHLKKRTFTSYGAPLTHTPQFAQTSVVFPVCIKGILLSHSEAWDTTKRFVSNKKNQSRNTREEADAFP